MLHRFDLIIWDWDGTLANSTSLITNAIINAAQDVGLTAPLPNEARNIIGLSLNVAIHRLFPEINETLASQLAARYRYHYYANEAQISLFEGVRDLIRILSARKLMLAIATGKGRRGLNLALNRSGLHEYFHTTRTVDECASKPHPQMIEEIMSELSVLPERTLMIGDTGFDLQMATNAKVASIGVSYGAHPREKLESFDPIAIFDEFSALKTWMLKD